MRPDHATCAAPMPTRNLNYNYTGNSLRYSLSRTTNDKADSGYENELIETSVGTSFEQYRNIFVIPSLSFSYDDLKVQDNASDALKKQKGACCKVAHMHIICGIA